MRPFRPALALVGALAVAFPAAADLVTLKSGKTIEGIVIEFADEIEVEGRHGSARFPRAMIARIEKRPVPWLEYENRRATIAANDAEAHFQLGLYCAGHAMPVEAAAEFRAAIAANPDHAGARKALGFVPVGRHWMTEEEYKTSLGYVKYKGEWLRKEEARLREESDREKALRKALAERVHELVEQTGFADAAVREAAYQALEKVDLATKLPVLMSGANHENLAVRTYAILELGRLKDPRAAAELAKRILLDPDPKLREMAIAALKNVEHSNPSAFLAAYLNDGRPEVRIRAAAAITLFPDRRAAGALVQALERAITRPIPQAPTVSGGVITAVDRQGGRFEEPYKAAGGQEIIARSGGIDRIALAELERVWIRKALKACTNYDFGMNLQMWDFWLRKQRERTKED